MTTAPPSAPTPPPVSLPDPSKRDSEYGIPRLAVLPLMADAPRRKGLGGMLVRHYQRLRQFFHRKGEGLYKEEDSKAVNTFVFVIVVAAVLGGLSYLIATVISEHRAQRPKRTGAVEHEQSTAGDRIAPNTRG